MRSRSPLRTVLSRLLPAAALSALVSAQQALPEYLGQTGGQVGHSLISLPDLNGDGIGDYASGAPSYDLGHVDAGAIEIFSGGSMSSIRGLLGFRRDLQMGYALARVNDFDSDGVDDLLVGALRGGTIAANDIHARIYSSATGRVLWDFLEPSSANLAHVAVCGLNQTIAVVGTRPSRGAPLVTIWAPGASSSANVILPAPSSLHSDFGFSLAGPLRDANGQLGRFVTSSPNYPHNNSDPRPFRGWVGAYDDHGTLLWSAEGDASRDYFGSALAVIDDLSGDGISEILVGAPAREISFTARPGFVRILNGATGATIRTWTGIAADDRFGTSVCALGDIDGDGANDFAAAAIGGGANGVGYTRIYTANGTVLHRTLDGAGAGFGSALAGAGRLAEGQSDLLVGHASASKVSGTSFSRYPGSEPQAALLLEFGAARPLSRDGVQAVWGGEPATLSLRSPNGARNGVPFAVMLQVFLTGYRAGGTPGFPELQIDFTQPNTYATLASGLLPAGGWSMPLNVPHGVGGLSGLFQGIALDASAPHGWITTQGIEVAHQVVPVIYVTPTGSDTNSGLSPTQPKATLSAAIALAKSMVAPGSYAPYPTIKLALGTFTDTPLLDAPISILGGCNPSNSWQRARNGTSLLSTSNLGFRIEDITSTVLIAGLDIRAANSTAPSDTGPSMSSIALNVKNSSSALRFEDCSFRASRGANGPAGNHAPNTARPGSAGSTGRNGYVTTSTNDSPNGGSGGAGGATWNSGGRGGAGGHISCTNWIGSTCFSGRANDGGSSSSGTSCGNAVNGGARTVCGSGVRGSNGSDGADGSPGANGTPSTNTVGYLYQAELWTVVAGIGLEGNDGCGARAAAAVAARANARRSLRRAPRVAVAAAEATAASQGSAVARAAHRSRRSSTSPHRPSSAAPSPAAKRGTAATAGTAPTARTAAQAAPAATARTRPSAASASAPVTAATAVAAEMVAAAVVARAATAARASASS
ncbi:MAG: hypothetical protein IPN34_11020 [Planctomycetes bacterium]|nr:hypothetical protein [Planctomycetota bacterium]